MELVVKSVSARVDCFRAVAKKRSARVVVWRSCRILFLEKLLESFV